MTHAHPHAALLLTILILSLATPAFAQDTSTELVDPPAVTQPPPTPQPMRKPLDAIRQRVLNAQQNVNNGTLEVRPDLKLNAQMQLKNATSGTERKNILKNTEKAANLRHANASSTALRLKMKAAMQMHGGQIRQHFSNTIRHLEKFMKRIDSRIEKLKAAGIEVSRLESQQAVVEAALAQVQTDMKALKSYMDGVTDQSDRAQVKTDLEIRIEATRKSLKNAHEEMRALVKALVEASDETTIVTPPSASTTIE